MAKSVTRRPNPQPNKNKKIPVISPEVMSPTDATLYLGMGSTNESLKISRATGQLWGVPAPKFIRAGVRKVVYRKSDLDEFIADLESHGSNAQEMAAS